MRWYLFFKATDRTHIVRLLAVVIAITISMVTGRAWALGLGEITLRSEINQPLDAQIQLVAVSPGELDGLTVSLASPFAFQRAGIDRSNALKALNFRVEQSADGPVIRISGSNAIEQPLLRFLIQAEWPTGRMVREYSVLLDPSAITPNAGDNILSADTEKPSTVNRNDAQNTGPQSIDRVTDSDATDEPVDGQNTDINIVGSDGDNQSVAQTGGASTQAFDSDTSNTLTGTEDSTQASIEAITQAGTEAGNTGGREVTVQSGDTLSLIAEANAIPGVSTQQMMMALLNANQDAFIDGNVNLVKVGAILRVPDRSELTRMSQIEAVAQLGEQNQLWREYRDNLYNAAGTRTEPAINSAANQPAAPAISDSAQRILDLAEGEVRRTMELNIVAQSNPTTTVTSATADNSEVNESAQLAEINRKIQLAGEELTSTRLEKIDLAEQSSDLNNTIVNIQSLVAIRQNEIARLEDELARLAAEQIAADASSEASLADAQGAVVSEPATANEEPAPIEVLAGTSSVDESASLGTETETVASLSVAQPAWYSGLFRRYSDLLFICFGILCAFFISKFMLLQSRREQTADTQLEQSEDLEYLYNYVDEAFVPTQADIAKAEQKTYTPITVDTPVYGSHVAELETVTPELNLAELEYAATSSDINYDETLTEVDVYLASGLDDIEEEILGHSIVQEQDSEAYVLELLQSQESPSNDDVFVENHQGSHLGLHQDSLFDWDASTVGDTADLTPDAGALEFSGARVTHTLTDVVTNTNAHATDVGLSNNYATIDDDLVIDTGDNALSDEHSFGYLDSASSVDRAVTTTRQYKIVSSLFLGWCALSWMPEIAWLSGSNIGLAQLCMLAIVVCLWGVQSFGSIDTYAMRVRSMVYACIVAIGIWASLGVLISGEWHLSSKLLFGMLQGIVVLYLVTSVLNLDTLKLGIRVCAGMAFISVFLSLVAPHIVGLEKVIFHGKDKAYGLFEHFNQFGIVLAMGVPITALLVLNGRKTLASLTVLIALLWGLGLSESKTNIVVVFAMLFMVVIYAIATSRHRVVLGLVFSGIALYTFITGFPLLTTINPPGAAVLQEFLTYGGEGAQAVTQRTNLWQYALSVMANNPMFGEGLGQRFMTNGELTHHSHNVFLDFGRSIGVPGAIAIFAILFASLVLACRTLYYVISKKQTLPILIVAGGCISIIGYIFSSQLTESFGLASSFFFWLSLGLVLRRRDFIIIDNSVAGLVPTGSIARRLLRLLDRPINSGIELIHTMRQALWWRIVGSNRGKSS